MKNKINKIGGWLKRWSKKGLRLFKRETWRVKKESIKMVLRKARGVVRWSIKIDKGDGQLREPWWQLDILRYIYRRVFDINSHIKWGRERWADFRFFCRPPVGYLSWKRVVRLGWRNVRSGKSRMVLTIGGVAVGVGAIVLLVSFGYGLQEVVTGRIIWPDALRITEANSETANVRINKEMLEKIKGVADVKQVAPSIRLAGQLVYKNSKMDTVVVGAGSDFLKLIDLKLVEGSMYSKDADTNFLGDKDINEILRGDEGGEVAGVETESLAITVGDPISDDKYWFRLRDDSFVPVRESPKKTSAVVGYARGSILVHYEGQMVWGGVYEDQSGLGRVMAPDGKLRGKWLVFGAELWEDVGGVYREKRPDGGEWKTTEGYVAMEDVYILSEIEKQIEVLMSQGAVLGDITTTEEASQSADNFMMSGSVSTTSAKLIEMLGEQQKEQSAEDAGEGKQVVVRGDNPKEMLISTGLLRAWNKKVEEVIGEEVDIRYLVTSSILPTINGRVFSDSVKYKIIGVFSDNAKPMVYVPLGDIESMGINTYSSVRIMANDDADLPGVRTVIQSMGLVTRSVADTLAQIVKLFSIIRFLLGSFGAIALVVALFGMFNTLTVSLLERTREIGVMKSLGTTNVDVSRIFLVEAVIISFCGGLLGVMIGLGLGKILDGVFYRFSSGQGQSLFVMPLTFGLFIVMMAVVVGAMTGLFPAKRASKISALNALRYE